MPAIGNAFFARKLSLQWFRRFWCDLAEKIRKHQFKTGKLAQTSRAARPGRESVDARAEQSLRGFGATKINLLVEPGNHEATEFYRALGYSDQPQQVLRLED
jgi:hypothetical protein